MLMTILTVSRCGKGGAGLEYQKLAEPPHPNSQR